MGCSPPGSSVHVIFQARILEWVAISFSVLCSIVWFFMMWLYSCIMKLSFTIWSSNCAPRYLPKWVENLCPCKKQHTDIDTAALFIIAGIWKLPGCRSGGEWIHKLMHPDNGILSRDKEKWALQLWKDREEPEMHVTQWSQYEKAMCYVIPSVWHSGKGQPMETVKRSGVTRGWVVGRDEQAERKGFLWQWNYLLGYYNGMYMTIYICQNSQNVQGQEWVLMQTSDFGNNHVSILVHWL